LKYTVMVQEWMAVVWVCTYRIDTGVAGYGLGMLIQ